MDASAARAPWQGDVFITTFDGGSIDGLQIYNNTHFWNPSIDMPWIEGRNVNVTGNEARFIMNNIVYSTAPTMLDLDDSFGMDRDLYWLAAPGRPVWKFGSVVTNSMDDFRNRTGRDWNGIFADPKLNDPMYSGTGRPASAFTPVNGSPAIGAGVAWDIGGRDFFGNYVPDGGSIKLQAPVTHIQYVERLHWRPVAA